MTLCLGAVFTEAKYKHMKMKMGFGFFLQVILVKKMPSGAGITNLVLFGDGQ